MLSVASYLGSEAEKQHGVDMLAFISNLIGAWTQSVASAQLQGRTECPNTDPDPANKWCAIA
jgi:hypothetical protein